MLDTETLLEQIQQSPEQIQFKDVIAVIENEYDFTPTAFTNGKQINGVNENNGSCKIFAFAQLHNLTAEQTLNLFGHFYRTDVLENPTGDDHQNIRQFMISGWHGIEFNTIALAQKAS